MLSRSLQPGIWYVVDDVNGFYPSFRRAISLSPFLYENLLQLSGIISKYGDNYRFDMRNLDIIRISLQENITVNTSRCFLERGGKNLLFLCIDAPLFRSPREQAKSRHRINIQDNQLEGTNLLLLCRLSNQHAPEPEPIMMEHVPILVEEVKEGEAEAEEVVEDVIEEAERQEQEYEPYQLTHYYRNQLEQFELDYVRWEENQYHLCHQHFEEIMLE
jgi:hypothetical protein